MPPMLPYTGKEFLESLDDGREVWIYSERVGKITEHPAFRNTARMVARLYRSASRRRNPGRSRLSRAHTRFTRLRGRSLPVRAFYSSPLRKAGAPEATLGTLGPGFLPSQERRSALDLV